MNRLIVGLITLAVVLIALMPVRGSIIAFLLALGLIVAFIDRYARPVRGARALVIGRGAIRQAKVVRLETIERIDTIPNRRASHG